jgi:hypothetical protein
MNQKITFTKLARGAISTVAREFPSLGSRYIKSKRPGEKDETGGSVSAEYCYSVFLRHLHFIRDRFPNESLKSMVEIGPGDSIGIGIGALLSGFSHYSGLDAQFYAKKELNIELFQSLRDLFSNRTDIPADNNFNKVKPYLSSYKFPINIFNDEIHQILLSEKRLNCIEEVLRGGNCNEISVDYIVGYDSDSVIHNSCDLILSQAALEHVMNIDDTYKWMAKWLRKGGLASLQIDFKSHGTSFDWNGHWIYTDEQWSIVEDSKTFRNINRLPLSKHLELLKLSGFEIEIVRAVQMPSRVKRRHLAEHWKKVISDEDLKAASAYILARKL